MYLLSKLVSYFVAQQPTMYNTCTRTYEVQVLYSTRTVMKYYQYSRATVLVQAWQNEDYCLTQL